MRDVIYYLSPWHTATWFTIAMFKTHPDVHGFSTVRHLNDVLAGLTYEHNVVKVINKKVIEEDDGTEKFVFHSHLRLEPDWPMPRLDCTQYAMLWTSNSLVTVRDPLMCLITRAQRAKRKNGQPEPDIQAHVQRWMSLAIAYRTLPKDRRPVVLCMDRVSQMNVDDRSVLVKQAFRHVGLRWCSDMIDWMRNWPMGYNTCGSYGSKRHYQEGDIEFIQHRFPEELRALKEKEVILRPFLEEELGYKNLMWWS